MNRSKKYIISLAVAALLIWFIADAFNQPGVQDLKDDFEEVALYRNENNTGPIIRIYAVVVTDTLWGQMKKYGAFMPHTKYGNTKVYFFKKGLPAPKEVYAGTENFDSQFKPYLLASYEKDGMGTTNFVKFPFGE
ncbi:hypothetical protein [Adhaeribacter aquaticus]|uniref:hypothetical protein n=1 Tax=Adhaeribacter aquaticus TaxID=299567 RepID=UPI0004151355|nr:hypothetical protein [Adhaeribacter aquaticus]